MNHQKLFLSCVGFFLFSIFLGCAHQLNIPNISTSFHRAQNHVTYQPKEEFGFRETPHEKRYISSESYFHYLQGQLFFLNGEYEKAEKEIKLALIYDFESPYLHIFLSETLWRIGKVEAAQKEAISVLELYPRNSEAHMLLAKLAIIQQDIISAIEHYLTVIDNDPTVIDAYLILGDIFLKLDEPEKSTTIFDRFAAYHPDRIDGYILLGKYYINQSLLDLAKLNFEKALQRSPYHIEALSALAHIYEFEDSYEKAIQMHELLLLVNEENEIETLTALSRLFLKSKNIDLAKTAILRLREYAHEHPEVQTQIGLLYLLQQYRDEAIHEFSAILKVQPNHSQARFYTAILLEENDTLDEAYQNYALIPAGEKRFFAEARARMALIQFKKKKNAEALHILDEAIKKFPSAYILHEAKGNILFLSGNSIEAVKYLQMQSKNSEFAPLYLESVAHIYEKKGEITKAKDTLEQALERFPKDENLMFSLGALQQKYGDSQASLNLMQEILNLNPDNAQALNFVGYLLAEQGERLDEAEKLVQRALLLKPRDSYIIDSLGWVYFKQGNYHKALAHLHKAAEQSPEEPVIWEHLGDVYQKISDQEKAREMYHRALQLTSNRSTIKILKQKINSTSLNMN